MLVKGSMSVLTGETVQHQTSASVPEVSKIATNGILNATRTSGLSVWILYTIALDYIYYIYDYPKDFGGR